MKSSVRIVLPTVRPSAFRVLHRLAHLSKRSLARAITTRSVMSRSTGFVALPERSPCAAAVRALTLLPDEFTSEQQLELLEDADDVGPKGFGRACGRGSRQSSTARVRSARFELLPALG